ncbi:MAG: ATP synthase F1 subunit delta [Ignavibacteriae bacterium]|nr:MAG: ATP synthase F1 subunit delta [Ignavibacteriota bacterium]
MANLRIANRYAEALLTAAEELHVLDKVSGDLTVLQRIIRESHEFLLFLKSPVIKKEKKLDVFQATFRSSVQPLTLQFLTLLTEKGREEVLPDVVESFFRLQDELLGIVHVHVKTAAELSQQQAAQIQQRFETYAKKKVRLDQSIDNQLIGGFVARIGDTVFDGSVRQQLELLRKRFTEEAVS